MLEISKQGQFDFPSRISARGVFFGATVSMIATSVFMALGGGLGILPAGPVTASTIREAGAGLAAWGTISWLAATFAGAFVSALNVKSEERADGLLNAIATWAFASTGTGVLAGVWLMSAISTGVVTSDVASVFWTRGAFWTYFTADLLALGSALLGGNTAVRLASKLSGRIEVRREEATPVVRRPAAMGV